MKIKLDYRNDFYYHNFFSEWIVIVDSALDTIRSIQISMSLVCTACLQSV